MQHTAAKTGAKRRRGKVHTGVCCIRRKRENIFAALEIVRAQEGKEKEREKFCLKKSFKAKMTYQYYDLVGMRNNGTLSKQRVAVLEKKYIHII